MNNRPLSWEELLQRLEYTGWTVEDIVEEYKDRQSPSSSLKDLVSWRQVYGDEDEED